MKNGCSTSGKAIAIYDCPIYNTLDEQFQYSTLAILWTRSIVTVVVSRNEEAFSMSLFYCSWLSSLFRYSYGRILKDHYLAPAALSDLTWMMIKQRRYEEAKSLLNHIR